ncbi:MAG: class II aldolase/adducin family protein [Betaproteobacteria bacterium]|nr:class II aldolase/adducin family protein [Betaproteobacteria bacterium]
MTDLSHVKIASLRERVSPQEWQARVDLAACYRLVALFGMNDLVYNHVTARVPGEEGRFLINPYGYAYEEITASSLVKIDFEGNIVHDSGTGYGINRAGFVIHGAVHRARVDVSCVIHTHSPAGMAVSALKCGLLPLTQNAMFFGEVAYHDYEGPAIDLDEQQRLVRDLGARAAMILRNHGLLTAGGTVCEAFVVMHWLERACQAQLMAMACNTDLNVPGEDVIRLTNERYAPGQRRKITELEWPALLRMLDRRDPSFRD